MLEDGNLVPGIQRDNRLQHRRKVLGLAQHVPPFLEPFVLVPIEIVDQRISFASAGEAGRSCLFDGGVGTSEHRIDGGELGVIAVVLPLPSFCRFDLRPAAVSPAGI